MEIKPTKSQIMEYPVNTPEWHFQQILKHLGEDINREGLIETPKRYIKFLNQFLNPQPFKFTTFKNEGTDGMITQVNIPSILFANIISLRSSVQP